MKKIYLFLIFISLSMSSKASEISIKDTSEKISYKKLAKKIRKAKAGDIILTKGNIDFDSYDEQIIINKPLTIKGINLKKIII